MHVDPYYCTECHCNHDKHVSSPVYFDIAGNCLAAGKWYLDNDEESSQIYAHEIAWKMFTNWSFNSFLDSSRDLMSSMISFR